MKVYTVFNEDGAIRGFYPDIAFPDVLDDNGVFVGRHPSVPADAVEISDEQWMEIAADPGAWRLIDGDIVPFVAPSSVPGQVSRAQGKIMLKRAGVWPRVLDLVAADATGEIDVWLNDATYWSRQSPYIAQMAAALNLTDAAVDQLFIEAVKISAE
ncbi:hypothetical protein [Methylobacterium ajmalii]|uniref:hypothetical protein n=1 Tax=Methylobacterium ajmalii TaxID=2738439 RepID=UPI002F35E2F5